MEQNEIDRIGAMIAFANARDREPLTIRPPGEELCRFGPDGALVSYSPSLAPLVAAIRRAALEEAATYLEARMGDGYRSMAERAHISVCATWVRDFTRDENGDLPALAAKEPAP